MNGIRSILRDRIAYRKHPVIQMVCRRALCFHLLRKLPGRAAIDRPDHPVVVVRDVTKTAHFDLITRVRVVIADRRRITFGSPDIFLYKSRAVCLHFIDTYLIRCACRPARTGRNSDVLLHGDLDITRLDIFRMCGNIVCQCRDLLHLGRREQRLLIGIQPRIRTCDALHELFVRIVQLRKVFRDTFQIAAQGCDDGCMVDLAGRQFLEICKVDVEALHQRLKVLCRVLVIDQKLILRLYLLIVRCREIIIVEAVKICLCFRKVGCPMLGQQRPAVLGRLTDCDQHRIARIERIVAAVGRIVIYIRKRQHIIRDVIHGYAIFARFPEDIGRLAVLICCRIGSCADIRIVLRTDIQQDILCRQCLSFLAACGSRHACLERDRFADCCGLQRAHMNIGNTVAVKLLVIGIESEYRRRIICSGFSLILRFRYPCHLNDITVMKLDICSVRAVIAAVEIDQILRIGTKLCLHHFFQHAGNGRLAAFQCQLRIVISSCRTGFGGCIIRIGKINGDCFRAD